MRFKTAKLDKKRWKIILQFPMDEQKVFDKVLQIEDAYMVIDHWEIPANSYNVNILKQLDFVLSDNLLHFDDIKKSNEVKPTLKIELPNGLKPRDYQIEGVSFIDKKKGRALIADEMGLGKTVQALLWLTKHPEIRPAIIVCPSFLKVNWFRETKKWIPNSNPEILESLSPYQLEHEDILIINYEIVNGWVPYLKRLNIKAMILDEAQYIKSPTAKRTKAVKRLAKYVPNIIGLSGTPIENAPIEIYNIIQMIEPTIFPNYYAYLHKYCGAKRNDYGGLDVKGATNTNELHYILKNTIMIRRLKTEVAKELPPKQIVQVQLKIQNWNEYKKAELEFISFVKHRYSTKIDEKEIEKELKDFAKRNKIEISDDLTYVEKDLLAELKIESSSKNPTFPKLKMLEKLAAIGKLDQILEWIETFLESGEKLVVFAVNHFMVDRIHEEFSNSVIIVGGMNKTVKQKAVDDFQTDDKVKLLIANIKAGGIGLTLTAASNVAIVQFPWSPSVLNQAIDRVHRISQKHQVTVWELIAENTIENRILEILNKKEKIISQVMDGKEFKDISVMVELIESYKQIKK